MKRIFFFTIFLDFISGSSPLSYLNSIRESSGTSALSYSKSLSFASRKHSIYLAKNGEYSHFESPYKRFFFAKSPWERIVKAGYQTKAVVENISFGERSYRDSIDKIMATLYHRLAFLDIKVNQIGYSKYQKVYVYDMSNSKVANLCKRDWRSSHSTSEIINICKDGNRIPKEQFSKAIYRVKRASKSLIIYPYPNQKGVALKLEKERPAFSNRGYGIPISVCFNDSYYRGVKLKELKLYRGSKLIKGRVVTFRNDRNKKIDKNCFILLPYHSLASGSKYKVKLRATSKGREIKKRWFFYTR
jgi:hypothetical protein